MNRIKITLFVAVLSAVAGTETSRCETLSLEGVTVTPHLQSHEMRYRQITDFSLGARTQLCLQNVSNSPLSLEPDTDIRLRGRTPKDLLEADEWAWYDFPDAWKDGTATQFQVPIEQPEAWLSAVTFLGKEQNPFPDRLIFHIANQKESPLRLESCRLWLPENNSAWRVLLPQEELRAQAYQALAARITSLYWFNLSLKSILKFPDLIEPIRIVGREIRLLEGYYLEGDAYHYERLVKDGQPDWHVSVVASPRGSVLFALDVSYKPDTAEKVFRFEPPRNAVITFPLPAYLRDPVRVLRINASEIISVPFELTGKKIQIKARLGDVNLFVTTHHTEVQEELEERRKELAAFEDSFGFDPARNSADLEQLKAILEN